MLPNATFEIIGLAAIITPRRLALQNIDIEHHKCTRKKPDSFTESGFLNLAPHCGYVWALRDHCKILIFL